MSLKIPQRNNSLDFRQSLRISIIITKKVILLDINEGLVGTHFILCRYLR